MRFYIPMLWSELSVDVRWVIVLFNHIRRLPLFIQAIQWTLVWFILSHSILQLDKAIHNLALCFCDLFKLICQRIRSPFYVMCHALTSWWVRLVFIAQCSWQSLHPNALFQQSVLGASVTMPGIPAAYLSPELPSSEALNDVGYDFFIMALEIHITYKKFVIMQWSSVLIKLATCSSKMMFLYVTFDGAFAPYSTWPERWGAIIRVQPYALCWLPCTIWFCASIPPTF